MKQELPPTRVETVALFPRNLRFITEYTFTEKQSRNIKIVLVSITSLFLLSLIALQIVVIWYNFHQRELLSAQRVQLQGEANYWEGIATKYQGYRDLYYRIAALEYRMGNVSESQKYLKKAFEADPNFPQGNVLGAHVGL